MQKLILGCLAFCSLTSCLQAELVYAAVSGLPTNFLPPPPPSVNMIHSMRPPHLQDGRLVRPQRSLYGPPIHGWNGPPVQPQSIGLGHISKQELITLLEAAKEAVRPEPEPEPEPESEPEAGAGPGSASAPGGPPAGVPLTVSLPAFVPIQLSAMYTAPPPPGTAAAAPEGGAEEEEEEDSDEEEDDEEEDEEEEEGGPEPEPAPTPVKPYYPAYHPWSSRGVYSQRIVPFASGSPKTFRARGKSTKTRSKSGSKSKSRKSKSRKSKSKKSRSKKRNNNNLRYAGSAQSQLVLPPPPFLARPPVPLKLVPSNQLLSNWK